MTDDFQVKQGINTQSSSGAYGLVGGAIGAAGAGYAAHHYTKPKYSSYDDIINESKDSFDKKVADATGEEKTLLERAKEIRDAGAKYNADLEAYKNDPANANELKETPKYKELLEKQNAAEKALADKRTAEMEKLKGKKFNGEFDHTKLPELINDATKNRKSDYKAKVETFVNRKVELLNKVDEAKIAKNNELVKTLNKEVEALEKEIEEYFDKEITSWYAQEGKKVKGAAKDAINNAKNNTLYNIQSAVEERMNNEAPKTPEIVAKYEKLVQGLKTSAGEKYAEAVEKVHGRSTQGEVVKSLAERKIKANKKVIDTLTDIQTRYENALKKGSEDQAEQIVKELKVLFGLIDKKEIITPKDKTVTPFAETLSKEENELLNKLLGDKKFDPAELKKVTEKLSKQNADLNNVVKEAEKFIKDIEATGVKGAYIKDGKLYDNTNKVVEEAAPGKSKYTVSRKRVVIPEYNKAKLISEIKAKAGREMTKEEIEAEVNKILAKDIEELNGMKAAVEAEKKGLEKGTAKTPEQLVKEFTEKNGTREEYVKKVTESNKEEIKKLLERKHGFNNWKIAGVAAAGALVVGWLASLMAPSDKA